MNRRHFTLAGLAAAVSTLALQPACAQPVNRPQTPTPPLPYAVEEVRITSDADGVGLAGSLRRPVGAERAPAVLLLGVAGPNDRDLSFAGHAAFAVIADRLARAGFAVLSLDDRGIGASGGDWAAASYDVLAADASSALAFLRRHPRVDTERVGVMGLSEGSAIAAMAAVRQTPPVAFVVMASPPGLGGEASLSAQFEQTLALYGVAGERAEMFRAEFQRFIALTRAAAADASAMGELEAFLGGPGRQLVPPYSFVPRDAAGQARLFAGAWYQSQLAFDPAQVYGDVRTPVLVLGGSRDLVLPPAQHHAGVRALIPHAEVVVIDGVSHLLQPSATGSPAEYAQTEITVDERVLDAIEQWLRR